MNKVASWIISHLSLAYKLAVIVIASAIIILLFPGAEKETHYDYSVNSFWNGNDLYAPFDFTVVKSQLETEQEEAKIRAQSLMYFNIDTAERVRARSRLDEHRLPYVLHQSALAVVEEVYMRGYVSLSSNYDDHQQRTVIVLRGNIGEEHQLSEFYTQVDIEQLVDSSLGNTSNFARLKQLLIDTVLAPNVCYDELRSQLELESRLAQTLYSSNIKQQGELLIAKGEYITPEKALVIASLERENDERFAAHYNHRNHNIGQFMLCIIAFAALFFFIRNTRHDLLDDNNKVTLMFLIIVLMAFITALPARINSDWTLLAPLCIAPILLRIFFDTHVALYAYLLTVVLLGSFVSNSYEFIFYQLVTGMVSIVTVRNFEKRIHFFEVALVVFCTYSLIYLAGKLSQDTNFQSLEWARFVMFFINATLTLMAYPLIYLFEKLFGITTNLTLLEISGTNTPALRELSRTAPGTFQHSMQVANISEDLVNEIGGNSLLARAGALYHDIGKLNAPLYFTENQNSNFNPHDNLSCEESAQIITQHVLDGITLAKKYRLPNVVVDFIRTHHGTTKTGYFYARWLNMHPGALPDESLFAYKGPKPFTREMAVVMIVDSIEAAARSLRSPTKESVASLVDNIVDSKIKEDQLSNCDITFHDIDRIKQYLKERIMSIYHVRVAYPVIDEPSEARSTSQK